MNSSEMFRCRSWNSASAGLMRASRRMGPTLSLSIEGSIGACREAIRRERFFRRQQITRACQKLHAFFRKAWKSLPVADRTTDSRDDFPAHEPARSLKVR